MVTLVSMKEEKNPDYGELRIGSAPYTTRIHPGSIVVANGKKYKVISAESFCVDSSEMRFIFETYGTPMEIEGIWVYEKF